MFKDIYKPLFQPLYKEPVSGKEHSLEMEDSDFTKYLRQNFYNAKLSNEEVYHIKQEWLKEKK